MLPSEKMQSPALWTTWAQRDAMTLFEMHHTVRSYRAWPPDAVVHLSDDNAYYPSLGITLADGRVRRRSISFVPKTRVRQLAESLDRTLAAVLG